MAEDSKDRERAEGYYWCVVAGEAFVMFWERGKWWMHARAEPWEHPNLEVLSGPLEEPEVDPDR